MARSFTTSLGQVAEPVTLTLEVDMPVADVYERWCQFDALPDFMRGYHEERQRQESRMVWRIDFGGHWLAWDAEVCEQIPQQTISWRNMKGRPCPNSGSIAFAAISASRTTLTLTLQFDTEPESPMHASLKELKSSLERDLKRFLAQ